MAKHDAVTRYRTLWQAEIDSAALYRAMAANESNDGVARVYRELAAIEDRHAAFWVDQLAKQGVTAGRARPSWRARALAWAARRFGAATVLPTVATLEVADRNDYLQHPETAGTRMTAQERTHARVLSSLLNDPKGAPGGELARIEGRHRNASGNSLRAAVLGANDGLCSNLSLVMGIAGATIDAHAILLTGLAGLLAGACSMALGEWISVTSSRELAEREMSIERDELAAAPEEEREELQLIYEAKGLPADEAKQLSERLVAEPKHALDVLTREELGLDPDELTGSPRTAAIASFLLFALGACFPVLPFVFLVGDAAIATSVAVSSVALFGIGAAITIFTGRPAWRSGGRQLVLGLVAAALTFSLGRLLGVALG
jgi:VIT1/CCC1 family predicted Fe2+/Mn2+ transporter